MPVHCSLIGGKYRIVEPSGKIAKGSKGNPRDGGGHASKAACNRQASVINRSIQHSAPGSEIELSNKKSNLLSRIVNSATKVVTSSAKAYVDFQSRIQNLANNDPKSLELLSYYDAAKNTKLNKDWRPGLASADQTILDDLDNLMARSRSMLRNDGVSVSGKKAFLRHVVGSGITARSAARDPHTGEMLETYNTILDRLWKNWANNPLLCDVEKTKTFAEKQALWLGEEFAVGGVFIVLGYLPNPDGVGLVLQEIEYEQADLTIQSYEGREVKSGIEVDEYNAPVAYHLYTKSHPYEHYSANSGRIPADRVIHIFHQDRIRQTRGTPWMSAVMPSIRNLAIYEQCMMQKARTEASYHGVVEQDATGGFGLPETVARQVGAVPPTSDSSDTSLNSINVNIQPGLFPVMNPGQTIKFPTPGTPNTMYQPFVQEQLKRVAAGIGLDIATVARWYGDTNFSAQKQAKLDIYAETDPVQSILIDKVLFRIRNEFIEFAIKEGRLKAVGYFETYTWKDAYRTTNWQGPPKSSVEPLKDASAVEKLMSLNLLSPQKYFNERGTTIEEVYAELEEAKKLRKQHGLEEEEVNKIPVVRRDGNPGGNGNRNDRKFSDRFSGRTLL